MLALLLIALLLVVGPNNVNAAAVRANKCPGDVSPCTCEDSSPAQIVSIICNQVAMEELKVMFIAIWGLDSYFLD